MPSSNPLILKDSLMGQRGRIGSERFWFDKCDSYQNVSAVCIEGGAQLRNMSVALVSSHSQHGCVPPSVGLLGRFPRRIHLLPISTENYT